MTPLREKPLVALGFFCCEVMFYEVVRVGDWTPAFLVALIVYAVAFYFWEKIRNRKMRK